MLSAKTKTEIKRLKDARKLLNQARILLMKCDCDIVFEQIVHAPELCDEEIKSLRKSGRK